ncbi:MAG: hypothetical protein K2L49_05225 [Muribaculaceae bacterium]|nr:hypothetical protein [Muribaculaceae bacterium]
MVLNYIWIAFFLLTFAVALIRTIFYGDVSVWSDVMGASFSSAAGAFELALGLTGVLSLWLGLMKIGERAGVIRVFGRLVSPLFSRLFPGVPKDHPAMGSIFMNVSANMLGLDNAATPLGLKAMQELQELNGRKDTATDAMIMFLVLNASGLCLIPISIMVYRAQAGAADPTDVFMPILLATFVATLVGIIALCIRQRIKLADPVLLAWLGGMSAVIAGMVWFFSSLPQESVSLYSGFAANCLLMCVIVGFILAGLRQRINMYEAFIEGARDGFTTAVKIIPYLVAILVAIGMFRASGAMDMLTGALEAAVASMGFDADWVAALPTAVMKPLSGSGSRGMMVDLMNTYCPDAFVSRVSAAIQGSTDTMFYVLAVYFGSVGVRRTRYAVPYALLADVTGSVAGIAAAYIFFG